MSKHDRRGFLKAGVGAAAGAGVAQAQSSGPVRKVHRRGTLFNQAVSYGNLLFIAGKGYHKEGDIKVHTRNVLDDIQAELENAGSSMDKVLKCNVYLADAKDFAAMNEEFKGRFGENPPVRTTIAAGWIPGN